jgi:hypothetical protein
LHVSLSLVRDSEIRPNPAPFAAEIASA